MLTPEALSDALETALVARNLRGMATVRRALEAGYVARAARWLSEARGPVIIGTGFPVTGTFETDGPVGAIALYRHLEADGLTCYLACAPPLLHALRKDFRVLSLDARSPGAAREEAQRRIGELRPGAIVAIERPGLAHDGRYYNMRGEDISDRCGIFDTYLEEAACPTIAIGDGGNEIGMGKVSEALRSLPVRASVTGCDELIVSDVSNWGAYAIMAMRDAWAHRAPLAGLDPLSILAYLGRRGAIDGVTRRQGLTEDGLDWREGKALIAQFQDLVLRHRAAFDAAP